MRGPGGRVCLEGSFLLELKYDLFLQRGLCPLNLKTYPYLLTMDPLVPRTMKNAAKCDT